MLGRLRIRGKFALVVALPLVAVAALTLPGVFDAVGRAQRAEEIGQSMQVANRVTGLVSELRQERQLALGYLFEVGSRSRLVTQGTRVNDRVVGIRQDAQEGALGPDGLSPTVTAAIDASQRLGELRELVLDRSVTAERVIDDYSVVIGQLIDSLRLLAGVDLATRAAQHVAALDAALRVNERGSQATDLLFVVAATGSPEAAVRYAAALRSVEDELGRFNEYATPEQLDLLDLMTVAYTERDETGAGAAFDPDPFRATAGQSAVSMFPGVQSLGQLGRFIEKKIITDVLIEVESEGRAELRNAYLVAAGALLVLLVVVAATVALARAVVRPLLRLTASANRVARVADTELARIADDESESPTPIRLDPVHVEARDEIGDLGRAFDRVQAYAIRLVERQMTSRRNVALMFGYLGRRTQNLVGRQLGVIDGLERNETDPQRLAELYRLDHIASRLHRNAGSLVVLSGSTGPDDHVAPLPLADIVRLALGEIEDYERVDVDVPPAILVAPAVIGDLVLVLAELMENATVFSPPHTRVTVAAAATGQGVHVSIVDHGIGMPPARLAEESARLAQRERLDLAPTEVLGLFVVGRLARRHGLRVTLNATTGVSEDRSLRGPQSTPPGAGGGVTAVVEIGARLLVPAEPVPAGVAPMQIDGQVATAADAPALEPPWFDVEALSRASRTLASGSPWNAFAVPPPELPAAPAAPPKTPPAWPAPAPAPTAAPAPAPTTSPAPGGGDADRAGLRRRVPGATLATQAAQSRTAGTRPRPPGATPDPAATAAADPDAAADRARDMIEQLETGVARATSELASESAVEPTRSAGRAE